MNPTRFAELRSLGVVVCLAWAFHSVGTAAARGDALRLLPDQTFSVIQVDAQRVRECKPLAALADDKDLIAAAMAALPTGPELDARQRSELFRHLELLGRLARTVTLAIVVDDPAGKRPIVILEGDFDPKAHPDATARVLAELAKGIDVFDGFRLEGLSPSTLVFGFPEDVDAAKAARDAKQDSAVCKSARARLTAAAEGKWLIRGVSIVDEPSAMSGRVTESDAGLDFHWNFVGAARDFDIVETAQDLAREVKADAGQWHAPLAAAYRDTLKAKRDGRVATIDFAVSWRAIAESVARVKRDAKPPATAPAKP